MLLKNISTKVSEEFLLNVVRIMEKVATPEVNYGLQDLREDFLARKDAVERMDS